MRRRFQDGRADKVGKHPVLKTPLPLRLSRLGIGSIVASYVAASLLAACVLGFLLARLHQPDWSFSKGLRGALSATWGFGELLAEDRQGILYYAVATITNIVGVVLPILFLGSFVFKLFRHDPIVWRKRMSLEQHPELGATLAIVFYPGVHSPLADVHVRVSCRIVFSHRMPRFSRNHELKVFQAGELKEEALFPHISPAGPCHVRVPLLTNASTRDITEGGFIEVQGGTAMRRHCEILVLISGTMVYTGDTFLSVHRYNTEGGLIEGQPQWIDAAAGKEGVPRTWAGWQNFEGNAELFIFIYGALMDESALREVIPGGLTPESGPHRATLMNWHRVWNSGHEALGQVDQTWRRKDGSTFGGVVLGLGLEQSDGSRCVGVVYKIPVHSLGAIDASESDQKRQDVTGLVSWEGMNRQATVHTYIPKSEAVEIARRGIEEGRAVVPYSYLGAVNGILAALEDPAMRISHQVPEPPCAIEDLILKSGQRAHLNGGLTDQHRPSSKRSEMLDRDKR